MSRTVGTDESISYAVTCAVSDHKDCPVTDLPPLHDTLDPDALDSLVGSETDDVPDFNGSVMFTYSDSHVTIWADTSVTESPAHIKIRLGDGT